MPQLVNIIREAVEKLIDITPMVVGPGVKTGLNIHMDEPRRVGSDLIVDAVAAIKEYGESDTATFYGKTFSIVNMLMCAACAWLIILTKPLATILYAKDFFNAWLYVPFLLISSV